MRDLQTGVEVPLPPEMAKLGPRFAVFAPDGKSVMTWASDGSLLEACELWDWPGGKKRFAIEVHPPREVNAPGFSPDGSAVFIDARSPGRWDAKTGKELPPAWEDARENRAEPLLSLRPNPRWLCRDEHDQHVIEAGTGKVLSQFRLAYHGDDARLGSYWGVTLSPAGGQYAWAWRLGDSEVQLSEAASCTVRRVLSGHRGSVRVLGFTPDGTRLLTAGGDHTILVWDMRLAHVPLPDHIKKETDAVKLWNTLATGNAKDAYLAMARLARDPEAAIKMSKVKLKPATKADRDTDAARLADSRAIELLESLDTDDSRKLLKELADGPADAFRTQEAKRALQRREHASYNAKDSDSNRSRP
jgi:WD40 repeat protein